MTIGEKIKDFARFKYGDKKTYIKLAEDTDMSPSTWQAYLRGVSLPGTPILQKLFKIGCDINWLLNEDESDSYKQYKEKNNAGINIDTVLLLEKLRIINKISNVD